MDPLLICGGARLSGELRNCGAKNANISIEGHSTAGVSGVGRQHVE